MEHIESTVEVDAAASVCYQKWHHFEQFPHFMNHVEEVRQTGPKNWHWVVSGPLGHRTEWDAELDNDIPNQQISWHSLTGSEVSIAGQVNFEALANNRTRVDCKVQYNPPAGVLGELVAHIFSDPERMISEDLKNFKHLVEGTNVPVEKVHEGRTLQPDPFVVPPSSGAAVEQAVSPKESLNPGRVQSGASESEPAETDAVAGKTLPPRVDEEDYELIYGLEDDLPMAGTSANLDRAEIRELQILHEEESPYLGLEEGAIYSEDLIDMRNDKTIDYLSSDIYTESMDILEEDLINYTEGIDEELDTGLGPRESIEAFEMRSETNSGASEAGFGPRESVESEASQANELNMSSPSEKNSS